MNISCIATLTLYVTIPILFIYPSTSGRFYTTLWSSLGKSFMTKYQFQLEFHGFPKDTIFSSFFRVVFYSHTTYLSIVYEISIPSPGPTSQYNFFNQDTFVLYKLYSIDSFMHTSPLNIIPVSHKTTVGATS